MAVETLTSTVLVRAKSAVALASLLIAACSRDLRPPYEADIGSAPAQESDRPEYRLGVRPTGNSRHMWAMYEPMLTGVNARLPGCELRLESAQSEATYNERIEAAAYDFAIVEPHRVLDMEKLGYQVIARSGAADRISGLIVVRVDSPIRTLSALRRQTMCFASPSALASTMLVKDRLFEAGLNPNRHIKAMYVGNDEAALHNVVLRNAEAAGVSREAWVRFCATRNYEAAQLTPRWQTQDLPGPAVMAHSRVTREHLVAVRNAMIELSLDETGRNALSTAGFSEFRYGDSASYDSLWEFVENFERRFGPRRVRGGRSL